MIRDDVVAEICRKQCWNTIRWGAKPFGAEVVSTLLGSRDAPEYFVIGTATEKLVVDFVLSQTWAHDEARCAAEGAVCHIAGFPVFVQANMPPNMVALVTGGERLFKGHMKYEVTRHFASWIEIPSEEKA